MLKESEPIWVKIGLSKKSQLFEKHIYPSKLSPEQQRQTLKNDIDYRIGQSPRKELRRESVTEVNTPKQTWADQFCMKQQEDLEHLLATSIRPKDFLLKENKHGSQTSSLLDSDLKVKEGESKVNLEELKKKQQDKIARQIIELDFNGRVDKTILRGQFYDSMGYALENIMNKYKI